jgi:achilleol B synthase
MIVSFDQTLYDFFPCNTWQTYVDAGRPHAVNTAWAMLALIYAGQVHSLFMLF